MVHQNMLTHLNFFAQSIDFEAHRVLGIRPRDTSGAFELMFQAGLYPGTMQHATLKSTDLEPLSHGLHVLDLPPKITEQIGFDGVTYRLWYSLSSPPIEKHYSWWLELPPEWQALQPVLDHLDELIFPLYQIHLLGSDSRR